MTDDERVLALYTVYYRCRDGVGTQIWRKNLTRAEALAQQRWCFNHRTSKATFVWALDDKGRMLGDTMVRESYRLDGDFTE